MVRIKTQIFLLLFMVLGSLSCNTESQPNTDQERPNIFFDLQTYFDQEVDRLQQLNKKVKKDILLGDQSQVIQPAEVDFRSELQIFVNSDINKIAWEDKYKGDTTFQNKQLKNIRYEAIDTTLRTKLLEISYQDGSIEGIKILNSTKSLVAETFQELRYQPQSGYTILNDQKTLFSKKQKLKLKVDFL